MTMIKSAALDDIYIYIFSKIYYGKIYRFIVTISLFVSIARLV